MFYIILQRSQAKMGSALINFFKRRFGRKAYAHLHPHYVSLVEMRFFLTRLYHFPSYIDEQKHWFQKLLVDFQVFLLPMFTICIDLGWNMLQTSINYLKLHKTKTLPLWTVPTRALIDLPTQTRTIRTLYTKSHNQYYSSEKENFPI